MLKTLLFCILLVAALSFPAVAQVTTAAFYGTVTDPTGAVIEVGRASGPARRTRLGHTA